MHQASVNGYMPSVTVAVSSYRVLMWNPAKVYSMSCLHPMLTLYPSRNIES